MSTLSATNKLRQTVLGYPVDLVDESIALEIVESAWRHNRRLQIITLNAEMVVAAQQDNQLDRIIRHAHLIIPDGAGIVWALKLSGQFVERLPGIDLSQAILHRAASAGRAVALLGGRPGIIDKLIPVLSKRHPGLKIVSHHHGYFTAEEEESIVKKMASKQPELLLVALGVPRQEYFIDRFQHLFPKSVIIGVGGSFDVWAGLSKRAPQFMQKLHLEWLFRLINEPWRLKRIGLALPNFALQVIREFLISRHQPTSPKNNKLKRK